MIFEGREWLCWDTPLALKEVSSAPDTPQSDTLEIYAKDQSGVSALFYKDDSGAEINLSGGITGTGVANQITIWSGTTVLKGETGLIWDDTNNDLIVGATSTQPFATLAGRGLAIVRGTGVIGEADVYGFGVVGSGAIFRGLVARGTLASPTQALADDNISLVLSARDNSTFGSPARVVLACAETQTTTAHGSYITLDTTPLLSTTRAERFRVGPSGQLGIGGATYGGSGDIFSSGGASAAPSWVTRATLNAALDHGTLAGLTDDDHAQYALLQGRVDGQQLYGGNAASNDLDLRSTTHATKGVVRISGDGGHVQIGGGTVASELRFAEPSGSGSNYTAFKAQAQAGDVTYTLPAADATVSGYALKSDAAGVLSWGAVGVSDHGALTGLSDDDHAQYALLAGRTGTNDFTGDIGLTGNLKLPATTTTVGQIKSSTDLLLHTFGSGNTFLGIGAGNLTLTTGTFNTGVGIGVLGALTTGQFNVAVGRLALRDVAGGSRNIAIGNGALIALTSGDTNFAIGTSTLSSMTTGSSNFGIGDAVMTAVTSGTLNVGIGPNALTGLTTGSFNTAIGANVMANGALVGASSNTGIGYGALINLADANENTAIGRIALLATTTGAGNTGVGYGSGATNTTGSSNVFIGDAADASAVNLSNAIAIGAGAVVGSSNYMMLGTSAICVGIGGAAKPTTGTLGLIFGNGTALATMAANTAGLYAADITAGNSAIHALTEAGDLIKLYKTGTYTPTNVSADRSYDANSTTVDELADVLGTLIADLQLTGLIG